MSLITDIFGIDENAGDSELAAALQELQGLDVVDVEKLLEAANYDPQLAEALTLGPSAYEGITSDPDLIAAQKKALASLQGISDSGGMTLQDKANLNKILTETGAANRGAQSAIMQNANERGTSGSGLELVSRLKAGQDSANSANQSALDVAAQAQQRALEALAQSGELAGDMSSTKFNQDAQVAAAKDAISKFNTANAQDVSNTNVNRVNTANQSNAQKTADAYQQDYENRLNKANAIAGTYRTQAENEQEKEKQKAQMTGSLISGGAAVAGGLLSDENCKEGIEDAEPMDMEAFLSSIDPKWFKYKKPSEAGASGGENVGVMAQDVEKSPVGATMVKERGGKKMLDMQKGFGVILAALAALNDKIEAGENEEMEVA